MRRKRKCRRSRGWGSVGTWLHQLGWAERARAPPVNPLLTLPYPEAPPPDWVEDSGVPQSKVEKGGAGKRAVSVLH